MWCRESSCCRPASQGHVTATALEQLLSSCAFSKRPPYRLFTSWLASSCPEDYELLMAAAKHNSPAVPYQASKTCCSRLLTHTPADGPCIVCTKAKALKSLTGPLHCPHCPAAVRTGFNMLQCHLTNRVTYDSSCRFPAAVGEAREEVAGRTACSEADIP